MTNRLLRLLLLSLSLSTASCGMHLFGAELKTAKTEATAPGEVTVYVSVRDGDDPVGYLNKGDFKVYENGVPLDSDKVGLRLLPRDQIAVGHTILLLDLSDAPSPQELQRISGGAAQFVEKVTTTQAVTVLAFDGSERPKEVASYAQVSTPTKRPLPPLAPFLSEDTSRDLNGALNAAISGLSKQLQGQKAIQYGTVVSLVRGPDLAGRLSNKELKAAIGNSSFQFFAIAPEGTNFGTLADIAGEKLFRYDSLETLPLRFQDLGMRVRAAWESHYLIYYCSPARAGKRELRVEIEFQNEAGVNRKASSNSEFSADGFTSGCQSDPGPSRGNSPRHNLSSTSTSLEKNDSSPKNAEEGTVVAPPSGSNYE